MPSIFSILVTTACAATAFAQDDLPPACTTTDGSKMQPLTSPANPNSFTEEMCVCGSLVASGGTTCDVTKETVSCIPSATHFCYTPQNADTKKTMGTVAAKFGCFPMDQGVWAGYACAAKGNSVRVQGYNAVCCKLKRIPFVFCLTFFAG